MSHMHPQLTTRDHWLVIETTDGVFYLDWEYAGSAKEYLKDPENISFAAIANELHIYTEVGPEDIHNISDTWGYGARLSAPGYLDSTYWAVFETQKQAAQYLIDTFGSDDSPEGWEAELEQFINDN